MPVLFCVVMAPSLSTALSAVRLLCVSGLTAFRQNPNDRIGGFLNELLGRWLRVHEHTQHGGEVLKWHGGFSFLLCESSFCVGLEFHVVREWPLQHSLNIKSAD